MPVNFPEKPGGSEEFNFESWQPWSGTDFARHTYTFTLSAKLWGDADNLQRQLSATRPIVPEGLGLAELRFLERLAFAFLQMKDRVPVPGFVKNATIVAAGRRWSIFEARYEIVRRAIESVEGN